MQKSNQGTTIPKSIRHKRILDIAAEKPDAPLEELAEEIPSATAELVEHVLEEYSDPVGEEPTAVSEDDEGAESVGDTAENADTLPDRDADTTSDSRPAGTTEQPASRHGIEPEELTLEELSEKQRTTLRAIRENPEATQAELAEQLDVSAPTISNRVNSIDGFEWRSRQAFVATVYDEPDASTEPQSAPDQSATDGGIEPELDNLAERVGRLERQRESWSTNEPTRTVFDDPELLHKVVHACMDSTNISEDEELQILKNLLPCDTTATSDE